MSDGNGNQRQDVVVMDVPIPENPKKRRVGGRPKWEKTATPFDDMFIRAINDLKRETGWTYEQIAWRMTFIKKQVVQWLATQSGKRFIELPADMPMDERDAKRDELEGKEFVVWHDEDNRVTPQSMLDWFLGETQPTLDMLYLASRVFKKPISRFFGVEEWSPVLGEELAIRWENLTEGQRRVLVQLADNFEQENIKEEIKTPAFA